jgi:hypothetical protein
VGDVHFAAAPGSRTTVRWAVSVEAFRPAIVTPRHQPNHRPLAEPEEASGRQCAESQIEPWFASCDPRASYTVQRIGSSREENDAEEDCPAYPKAEQSLLLRQIKGADCQRSKEPAVSRDGVRP